MIVEPSDVELQARRARDRALVEAHCSGDTRAFTTIVADHYRVLLAQAERRLGDRGAAEDAVQETFERAFRAVCKLGRDGEYRLGAWLSRILFNVCADHGGRIAAERNLSERVAVREVPEADLGESFSDPYILRAVREAIAALPSSQRDTFLLKEMDGLSYPQIADRLEISEDNARARVHRARATLRRSLALTRAMFGAVIAAPIGLRAFFRRSRDYTAGGQGASVAEAGSGTTAQTIAAHVAASPVGQMVASVAPSGAFRGSVIAGIASLAVTGAIAIPAVTSSDHARTPSRVDAVAVQGSDSTTTTAVAAPAGAASSDAAPPAEGLARAGEIVAGTVKDAVKPWWTAFLADPSSSDATDAPSDASGDPATPLPDLCATSSALSASSARSVVSTLDLPSAELASQGDNVFTFSTAAALADAGSSAQLRADVTTCLAPDGSYGSLVVELTDGTDTVSLASTSRYLSQDGIWVFRGSVTTDAEQLPWRLHRDFLARLQVAGTAGTQTATLSFAFFADEGSTAPQGDTDPIVVPPSTTTPPTGGGGSSEPPTTTTTPAPSPPATTTPAAPKSDGGSAEGSGAPAAS